MTEHKYIFAPTGEIWPASSVDARLPAVGNLKASAWIDQNRAVEQMTWSPGLPVVIEDRLIAHGGWFDRKGCCVFNLYRPPLVKPIAGNADRWLHHIDRLYGEHAPHIVRWCAHRVQKPADKINHAIVLGGKQGIGKDTLLEPVKHAVGAWNFAEVSPQQVLGRFNGFLKSVILRVSEARDLGEFDRFAFYDHMKSITAAPPDVLRIDEKHRQEYSIPNVCGVIITTNHKSDGIFLPGRRSPPFRGLVRPRQERLHDLPTGTSSGDGTAAAGSTSSPIICRTSTSPPSIRRRRRRRPKPSSRSSTPPARPRTPSSPTPSTTLAGPWP